MPALITLILFPLAIAYAQPFDIQDPAFWRKSYPLAKVHCSKSILLETRSFKKISRHVETCIGRKPTPKGIWAGNCLRTIEEADAILEGLRQAARVLAYDEACRDAPPMPELDYKRLHLAAELSSLAISSKDFPGITGLLDWQLKSLDWLIARRDGVHWVDLTVVAVLPDVRGTPSMAPLRINHSSDGSPDEIAQHPWVRGSPPACDQARRVDVTLRRFEDRDEEQRFQAVVRQLGPEFKDKGCALLGAPDLLAAVFSLKPSAAVQREITALPGFLSWHRRPEESPVREIHDDEKLEILEREIKSSQTRLSRTPHIKALLDSEMGRLLPQAQRLRELRAGTLVFFRFDRR